MRIPRSWKLIALAALALGASAGVLIGAAGPPAPPDIRAEIARRIDREVTPLRDEAAVDAYLARLEARARANGRVSALEVEPGIEAIRRQAENIGAGRAAAKWQAFVERMAALSAQLDGRAVE